MSKLIGREVRIVLCNNKTECPCVSNTGVICEISEDGERLTVMVNKILTNQGFIATGFYEPHELRYLNNKEVKLCN